MLSTEDTLCLRQLYVLLIEAPLKSAKQNQLHFYAFDHMIFSITF